MSPLTDRYLVCLVRSAMPTYIATDTFPSCSRLRHRMAFLILLSYTKVIEAFGHRKCFQLKRWSSRLFFSVPIIVRATTPVTLIPAVEKFLGIPPS